MRCGFLAIVFFFTQVAKIAKLFPEIFSTHSSDDDFEREFNGGDDFFSRYGWTLNLELFAETARISLFEAMEIEASDFLYILQYRRAKDAQREKELKKIQQKHKR